MIGKRNRIFNPDAATDETQKEFYEDLFKANTEKYFIYRRNWSTIMETKGGVMQGMAGMSSGDIKPFKLTPELEEGIQNTYQWR